MRGGHKGEQFFFAFLDELDHFKHKKCNNDLLDPTLTPSLSLKSLSTFLILKGLEENLEALIRNTSDYWECLECGKQAKTKQHIKYHAETHLGIKHICRHCGRYYKTTHSLSVHISQSHKLYTD